MAQSHLETSAARQKIIRSILWAFGVIILLFFLFEIIDFFWLHDLEMETLHVIYIIRGLFISLIAVLLVGWLFVKTSGPLLSTQEWVQGERKIKKERLKKFTNWFIIMRWVAIFVASVLVFIVVRVNEWLPREVWWPLVITIGCLVVLNTAYTLIVRNTDLNNYLLPFQAYADLILLTVLLHFSGGIENPLTLMLLIHVFIAGIILSRKHLYAITATAIVLLIIMAAGEATGLFQHYTLNTFPHFEEHGEQIHAAHMPLYVTSHVGLTVTIFLLTAYFIGTIMNRIRHDEQQLEQFADQSLEQRQLIEKALETTKTGLCVFDKEGKPSWTNQIWESWFGPDSVNFLESNNYSEESVNASDIFRDGKNRLREVTRENANSKHDSRTFQITTAPLVDKDGNFDHIVSLASDITDQKKAQEQMHRAGKLAAVGELAGKVAHEVNNPISIISAKCRLLLSGKSDQMSEKVSEELIKITDAADRVSDIAKGLLSYCRPSTSTRKKIDIRFSIGNALSMIEQSAEKNNVIIINRLPEKLPFIEANQDEMQQVFLNLFLNALDAMPKGGKLLIDAPKSQKVSQSESRHLTIIVQDTGVGIPDKIRQQVYEPFFTTKEEGKGTGLGLSICIGLIRSHKGEIDIRSKQGQGTWVTIKLPVYNQDTEVTKNG